MKPTTILLFALAAISPHAAAAQPAVLRIRAEPSPTSRVIARAPATEVRVGDCTYVRNTWCAVTVRSTHGYVSAARLRGNAAGRSLRAPSTTRVPSAGAPTTGRAQSSGRQYYTGSRGGCYYLTASGRKVYVDHANCAGSATNLTSGTEGSRTSGTSSGHARSSAGSREYTRGPRGGCYYLSGSGRKVHVDHSLCN